MNKSSLLSHLKHEVYCRLKPSKIHGIGIFAIKKIPKGTDPFPHAPSHKSIVFKKEELKDLDIEVKKIIHDLLVFEGDTVHIPACGINCLDVSFYINHSDTPNTGYSESKENLIALRDIEAGEELTADYKLLDNKIEIDF